MSKEIEEMAKIMCHDAGTKNCNIKCNAKPICDVNFYAERLFKEGYRKQSEVVRCKDCVHWMSPTNDDAHYCELKYGLGGLVAEEDYCSHGERKE